MKRGQKPYAGFARHTALVAFDGKRLDPKSSTLDGMQHTRNSNASGKRLFERQGRRHGFAQLTAIGKLILTEPTIHSAQW